MRYCSQHHSNTQQRQRREQVRTQRRTRDCPNDEATQEYEPSANYISSNDCIQRLARFRREFVSLILEFISPVSNTWFVSDFGNDELIFIIVSFISIGAFGHGLLFVLGVGFESSWLAFGRRKESLFTYSCWLVALKLFCLSFLFFIIFWGFRDSRLVCQAW